MARISLEFREHSWTSQEITDHVPRVIRLRCAMEFDLGEGAFTKIYRGIVDTGAPITVIPQRIWHPLPVRILVHSTTLGGISKRPECRVPARFGIARGRLVDRSGTASHVAEFPAYLAQTDEVPLLIGFASLLSEFDVHFNYQCREAWVGEA